MGVNFVLHSLGNTDRSLRPSTAAGPGTHPDVPAPHAGGLNTIFVDGHVEWCRSDEWYDKFKFAE